MRAMAVPVLGVVHVNVNCSDLARSLAFYRDLAGLAALVHTQPLPQDGSGFGLPGRVVWDAHLLHDARGALGPAVDLLEWKSPPPIGKPHADANALGMFRLCLSVPDLDAMYAKLVAAGVPCLSPPVVAPLDPAAGLSVRFFCARDPDGTAVEFLEAPGAPRELRLLHVNVNCRDLARSADWYRRVLGLVTLGRSSPGRVDGAGFGWDAKCEWRAEFLAVAGASEPFVIDLLEWRTPRPLGAPYREANHLGLFRLAFLVEDAAACHAELLRHGVETSPPVWLEMGPEVPIAGLWALFFRDPDGTCLELIQGPEVLSREKSHASRRL
jgi:catechol 2,3-dioxygenase-like lactoylglutathione lyase family enzyme